MNKLPLLLVAAAAMLLVGCQSSTVKIDGRFVGTNAKSVYLEQTASFRQQIVDSTALDAEGNFHFEIKEGSKTPSLYNILCNGERIPLFAAAGDRLVINSAGSLVSNYTVEGSEESALVREFYQSFINAAQQLDQIAIATADTALSEAERTALVEQYSKLYYETRRAQIAFITRNKESLAAVYAIYQRLPGDRYLYNGTSDVIYYRTVAEALAPRYPESPYLKMLQSDIAQMDASSRLAAEITESTFPEIELPDMYGKKIKLSSLQGKVFLLEFWSAALGNSNVQNAELKEVYAKYKNAKTPFEIYQVAIDTSKPHWITAVQEQALPWISVSDLRGQATTALGIYNVQKLPSNFLFNKEGEIVARDIRGAELEKKLAELTR